MQAYLDGAEVEGGFADVVYANFGVYGELAFVAVHLEDALVFVDPLNGNLFGPLEPGSALEAPPLLMEHADAYEEGMGVRYYSAGGCPTIAGWVPYLPPGPSTPVAPIPGAPVVVFPPWCPGPGGPCPLTLNPNLPGWVSGPWCTPVGTFCDCAIFSVETLSLGGLVYRRDTYRCPPGTPCPPATVAGCTYRRTWYWW